MKEHKLIGSEDNRRSSRLGGHRVRRLLERELPETRVKRRGNERESGGVGRPRSHSDVIEMTLPRLEVEYSHCRTPFGCQSLIRPEHQFLRRLLRCIGVACCLLLFGVLLHIHLFLFFFVFSIFSFFFFVFSLFFGIVLRIAFLFFFFFSEIGGSSSGSVVVSFQRHRVVIFHRDCSRKRRSRQTVSVDLSLIAKEPGGGHFFVFFLFASIFFTVTDRGAVSLFPRQHGFEVGRCLFEIHPKHTRMACFRLGVEGKFVGGEVVHHLCLKGRVGNEGFQFLFEFRHCFLHPERERRLLFTPIDEETRSKGLKGCKNRTSDWRTQRLLLHNLLEEFGELNGRCIVVVGETAVGVCRRHTQEARRAVVDRCEKGGGFDSRLHVRTDTNHMVETTRHLTDPLVTPHRGDGGSRAALLRCIVALSERGNVTIRKDRETHRTGGGDRFDCDLSKE